MSESEAEFFDAVIGIIHVIRNSFIGVLLF